MIAYTTPTCMVCHEASTVWLDLELVERWKGGEFVQNVWPWMRPDERELLISGTHPSCWEELFGPGQPPTLSSRS